MSESWRTAAQRYRNPTPQPASHKASPQPRQPRTSTSVDVQGLIEQLSLFLDGDEGATARELLAASKSHINLGEDKPTMGYGRVYFLDGTGLHCSTEAMGMLIAYSGSSRPTIRDLPIKDLVEGIAACDYPSAPLANMLSWIRGRLDGIAQHAPA